MIFKPLQYDSGKVKELLVENDTTIEKGDALSFTGGYANRADENATEVRFVALQGVVSPDTDSDGDKKVLAMMTDGVEFEAETSVNTAQAQVNVVYALKASTRVVDNETPGDVFLVTGLVGPAADKKVRGYFLDRVSVENAS
jgi:hypothetical protein